VVAGSFTTKYAEGATSKAVLRALRRPGPLEVGAVSAHVGLQQRAHDELQRLPQGRASKREVVVTGMGDPERGERGEAVAVEGGAQGEAGIDECARVAKSRRLIRWSEIGERRVLGGERDQHSTDSGVEDGQDGELRGAAEVADERARPRRHLVEQVTVGAGARHARPRSTRASWTSWAAMRFFLREAATIMADDAARLSLRGTPAPTSNSAAMASSSKTG